MARHPDGIHIAQRRDRGGPIVCGYCHRPVERELDPARPGSYRWKDDTGSYDCAGGED